MHCVPVPASVVTEARGRRRWASLRTQDRPAPEHAPTSSAFLGNRIRDLNRLPALYHLVSLPWSPVTSAPSQVPACPQASPQRASQPHGDTSPSRVPLDLRSAPPMWPQSVPPAASGWTPGLCEALSSDVQVRKWGSLLLAGTHCLWRGWVTGLLSIDEHCPRCAVFIPEGASGCVFSVSRTKRHLTSCLNSVHELLCEMLFRNDSMATLSHLPGTRQPETGRGWGGALPEVTQGPRLSTALFCVERLPGPSRALLQAWGSLCSGGLSLRPARHPCAAPVNPQACSVLPHCLESALAFVLGVCSFSVSRWGPRASRARTSPLPATSPARTPAWHRAGPRQMWME